jgi:hypothetical protein
MHSRRTGGHDHPINAVVSDVVLDQILTGIRTHILIISGDGDSGKGLGISPYLFDIYCRSNVDTTMTDINTDFHSLNVESGTWNVDFLFFTFKLLRATLRPPS